MRPLTRPTLLPPFPRGLLPPPRALLSKHVLL